MEGLVDAREEPVGVPEDTESESVGLDGKAELDLIVNALSVTVDATSSIDVTGKGYLGAQMGGNESTSGRTLGNGIGAIAIDITSPCCSSRSAGGSFGGLGAQVTYTGPRYGDLRHPNHLGSGGASPAESGGNGGGPLRLRAARVTLDGVLRADGDAAPRFGGGGSGGSVFVAADVFDGVGTISAVDGLSPGQGGGGGGRIAIEYGEVLDFEGPMDAHGGSGAFGHGGERTVFLKGASQAFGDLFFDNDARTVVDASTPLRSVGSGDVEEIEPTRLVVPGGGLPVPDAATGALGLVGLQVHPNAEQAVTFTIVDNTATELFTGPADGDMTVVASPGDSFVGALRFDNISVTGRARVSTADRLEVTGTLEVSPNSALNAENLTLP